MTWWKDRLDKLRREDRPAENQPTLQLPLPEPPPEALEDEEPERGIAVIDFTL